MKPNYTIGGKTLEPTVEQQAILGPGMESGRNLSIVARAGSAKTTTLKMISQELPGQALFLAFNKQIVTDLKPDLPPSCKAQTLNSLGYKMLGGMMGYGFKLDTSKNFELTKALLKDKRELDFRRVFQGLRSAKAAGFCPHFPAKSLIEREEFFSSLEEILTPDEEEAVCTLVEQNLKAILKDKWIDFDDQILAAILPTSLRERYQTVLVDESQDLSSLNHQLLKKAALGARVIAVGDPLQAIYAFRGAHEHSMSQLASMFNTEEYKLTVSFRCARAIVSHVQYIAPDMTAPEWAAEGAVRHRTEWNLEDLEDAVLCRLNAPLFLLNSILFSQGINCEFVGHDTVRWLSKTMGKFGQKKTPKNEVLAAINQWERESRMRDPMAKRDRADSMRIIAGQGKDLGQMLAYLRRMMYAEGRLKLMTIHKSKGLEFDQCYILHPELIGRDGQEPNIGYVAKTRARHTLHYITLDGMDRGGLD